MCSGSDAPDAAPPMSALGVRRARHASTDAQRRGRFFNSANAFNVKLPPVPAGIHAEPARQALAADAPTGYVPCDQSAALACPWPATTPFMLARYARVRPGERLEADFVASGSLWYVIAGTGQARCGDETLAWSAGDIFHLPAGPAELLASGTTPAVLSPGRTATRGSTACAAPGRPGPRWSRRRPRCTRTTTTAAGAPSF